MKDNGQAGTAVIWGAGAVLLAFGTVLFMAAMKEKAYGVQELALVEAFVSVVLMVFGVVSFYMAHK